MQAAESVSRAMGRAADALDDADAAGAADPLALAENAAFGFWLPAAEPPALVDEAILCETNVVVSPGRPKWPLRDDCETARGVTKLFSEKFPEWARNYIEQDAQRRQQSGETNAPSFTEENVAQINELLESLLWLLEDNVKVPVGEGRIGGAREAHALLEKIRDLLPKDGGSSSSQQQQQQQSSESQQNQSNQQDSEQQDKEDQSQPEPQEQQPQEQQEKKEEKSASEQKEEPPPDVQEALRRALQREREHEAEKKRQRREFPLPPNERDW